MMKKISSGYAIYALLAIFSLTGCGGSDNSGVYVSGNGTKNDLNIMSRSWISLGHIESTSVYNLVTARDDNGNVIAVWRGSGQSFSEIMAARYDAATSQWSSHEIIDFSSGTSSFTPKVEMDSNGNAITVWFQYASGEWSIFANNFDILTKTWGNAVEIDMAGGGNAFRPELTMDGNGNAMAIWYQYDGSNYGLYSSRFNREAGVWDDAVPVVNSSYNTYYPTIDASPSGVAIAAWMQYNGRTYDIWASRYDPDKGWGTAELIENGDGKAEYPVLSINDNGDAVAAWQQFDGLYDSVYANIYNATTNKWSEPVLLEEGNEDNAYMPVVEINNKGDVVVAWTQSDGYRYGIYTNRYDPESGSWVGAMQMDAEDEYDSDTPDVAIDEEGNIIMVWQHYGERSKIKGIRYDAETGTWSMEEILCNIITSATGLAGNAYLPSVSFDPYGKAIVSWYGRADGKMSFCVLELPLH